MVTFYDDPFFDYRKFWVGRLYEDQAEKIALKRLLQLVSPRKKILDIGGGFGRMVPEYASLFEKCVLMDPSEKLLDQAKKFCHRYQNVLIKRGIVEKIPQKDDSFNTVISIRTFHHLSDPRKAIKEISRVLKPGGFLILEFANKMRFKNILKAVFSFNLNFFTNHRPIRVGQNNKKIPFFSYHPNQIKTLLFSEGFKIVKIISVSNFRSPLIKKIIPLRLLLKLESIFSLISSYFPPLQFWGPSIFILAQKKK